MTLATFAKAARERVLKGYYAPPSTLSVHGPQVGAAFEKAEGPSGRSTPGRASTGAAVRSVAPGAPRASLARAIRERRGIVAEIKAASPTAGALRNVDAPGVATLARAFERAGARGLSVVTIPEEFGGSLPLLEEATRSVALPTLMKDFLVDPSQLVAASALGASAVLLVPEILDEWPVDNAIDMAHAMGLEVVLETYDAETLRNAATTRADILAVNNRDLREAGLPVDLTTFARAVGEVGIETLRGGPEGSAAPGHGRGIMSLSGCKTRSDVNSQLAAGADAVLMGSHLMQAADPGRALMEVSPRSS
ncbi:MAG: indole-3-glycerol-phosphate synthase [Thermoplasmatota archaeon]